ncbi:hypothetical protein DNHGIG_40870 [Collibacillus ludicampi]|uniref:Uncharacterized protein n=1 Tax=Collibacillus ludicampi TaxID=2771369 RepID=A0AAV4LMC4_9BACL|nr:hypothetical protein [Collibacillus ludicampi]GIM48538.1 hypothetical protein DNHGIG_40870 [Collibacillus ludicampi]
MENRFARIALSVLFLAFFWFFSKTANAAVLLDDSFQDLSQIDTKATTSVVDTQKQEVRLPGLSNSLATTTVGSNLPQYVVPTTTGITWLSYDSSSQSMKPVASYSVSGVTALGVAVRQDSPSIWALVDNGGGQQSIERYDYDDGAGHMAENPYLTVTGLQNVLSITAQPNSNEVVTLSRSSNGTGVITTYMEDANTGQLVQVPMRSFDTGLADPLSISLIPNTPDVVVKTKSGVYFYVFDDASGTYTQNPAMTITDANAKQVESNSLSADTGVLLLNNATQPGAVYMKDDASSSYQQVPATFDQALGNAVSVSLVQGTNGSQMAMLFPDGSIHLFAMDSANPGFNYKDVPSFDVTGGIVPRLYAPSSIYQSVKITTQDSIELVRLTTQEQNDPNTSIQYEVSTDGGSTWQAITPGSWASVTPGSNIVLRATEMSADGTGTPRIKHVVLEGTYVSLKNLRATQIFFPAPEQTNPVPTTNFPVFVRAGGQVEFMVDSTGFMQKVTVQFSDGTSMDMVPQQPTSNETNTWVGWYKVDLNAPSDFSIGVQITGKNPWKSVTISQDPLLVVKNSVKQLLGVHLTE